MNGLSCLSLSLACVNKIAYNLYENFALASYLNRARFKPSEREKAVLFYNLLLRGKGKTHNNRTKKADVKTAMTMRGPLGWVWFVDLQRAQALSMIRQALLHEDIDVCAGAMRAMSRLQSCNEVDCDNNDKVILRKKLGHGNPTIVSQAILALALIGTEEDIENIRKFKNDNRPKVLEVMAYALSTSAYKRPEDRQFIESLLHHSNMDVKRNAEKALKRIEEQPVEDNNFQRGLSIILEKNNLDKTNNEENRGKARSFLLSPNFSHWNAGIRWFLSQGLQIEIENIIKEKGWQLRFAQLEDFDYYLYCPGWWRNAMD